MEYQEELAVVPLVPVDATPSTDTMLRMVLNHEALLVHHVLNDSLSGRPGQVAQATGAFAKAISRVTGEFNRSFNGRPLPSSTSGRFDSQRSGTGCRWRIPRHGQGSWLHAHFRSRYFASSCGYWSNSSSGTVDRDCSSGNSF